MIPWKKNYKKPPTLHPVSDKFLSKENQLENQDLIERNLNLTKLCSISGKFKDFHINQKASLNDIKTIFQFRKPLKLESKEKTQILLTSNKPIEKITFVPAKNIEELNVTKITQSPNEPCEFSANIVNNNKPKIFKLGQKFGFLFYFLLFWGAVLLLICPPCQLELNGIISTVMVLIVTPLFQ